MDQNTPVTSNDINDLKIKNLQAEFDTLSSRNRTLTATSIALAVIAIILAVVALAAGKSVDISGLVQTEKVRVVDSEGIARAVLEYEETSGVAFRLYDETRNPRIDIGLDEEDAPRIAILDESGTVRIEMALGADGTTSLELLDESSVLRARYAIDSDGSPVIDLYDPGTDTGSAVRIWDASGNMRVISAIMADGASGFALSGEEGSPRALLGYDPELGWGMTLWDNDDVRKVEISIGPDGEPVVDIAGTGGSGDDGADEEVESDREVPKRTE